MSAFGIVSVLLLVASTIFALSNPTPISLHFLAWEVQTSLALAVMGGVVLGGFIVFLSGLAGQQQLRARLRDAQARLREAEARLPAAPAPRPTIPGHRPEERP